MYALIENNAITTFPYTDRDLRKDHPRTGFPRKITDEIRAKFGVLPVAVAATPDVTASQEAVQDSQPTLIDGDWVLGWTVRDKTPEELAAEQETRRAQLIADLAAHRYGFETGGVALPNGLSVRTDRGTRASITEAVNALEAGLMVAPVPWKLEAGWADLTHADLKGIASAVAAHVQAGFAAERAVQAQIEAAEDLAAFGVPAAFAAVLAS